MTSAPRTARRPGGSTRNAAKLLAQRASRPKLAGDRNQCPGCGELFNSNSAFDKHRTGAHGVDRRCLTAQQMLTRGMVLGADRFWRGEPMRLGPAGTPIAAEAWPPRSDDRDRGAGVVARSPIEAPRRAT